MATIDIASNSALLELVNKLAEQNSILTGSTITIKGDTGETGNGISSIEKTKSEGLVDTYTITYTNGTTTTFNVTNGEKGEKGDKGDTGATGKSAYAYAQEGGYAGTEAEFVEDINPDNIKKEIKLYVDEAIIRNLMLK